MTATGCTGSNVFIDGDKAAQPKLCGNDADRTYTVNKTVNNVPVRQGGGIAAPEPIPALSSSLAATATSSSAFNYTATSSTSGNHICVEPGSGKRVSVILQLPEMEISMRHW